MDVNSSLVKETSSSINYGSRFPEWRPDNKTISDYSSCHKGNLVAEGNITIIGPTTINSLTNFLIQVKVTGFKQAQGAAIVIGFNILDKNNSLFEATTLFQSSIQVDGYGNSEAIVFSFMSPQNSGNYSLLVYAVHGARNDYFYYLSKTIDIEITQVVDIIPPVINDLLVNDKSYTTNMTIQGQTSLKANVTDKNLSTVKYTIDNITIISMELNPDSQLFEANLSSNSFPGTSVKMTIIAFDKGNNNASKSYLFTINNTGSLPNSDIITFKIDRTIIINDGQIDPIWEDIPSTTIPEFGPNGFIKTVQDSSHLYTLLAYDPQMTWISVEFNVSKTDPDYMASGTKGWIFGTGTNDNYYGEYYFEGTGSTIQKDTKNVLFFQVITKNNLNYIEAARLLDTKNSDTKDFEFTLSKEFTVVFASNVHHTDKHKVLTWSITDQYFTKGNNTIDTISSKEESPLTMGQISDIIFVVSLMIVIVTIFMHFSLRVISKPIKHEKRIVYSDKIPNQPDSISLLKTFIGKQRQNIFKSVARLKKKN